MTFKRKLRRQKAPSGLLMSDMFASESATTLGIAHAARVALRRGHQLPDLVAMVMRRGEQYSAMLTTRDYSRAEYRRAGDPTPPELDIADPPGSLRMLVDYDGFEQSELIDLETDNGR